VGDLEAVSGGGGAAISLMLVSTDTAKTAGISLLMAGILLALLAVPVLPAKAENPVLHPVARTGTYHERFMTLNERVQANQGNVDLIFVGDSITQRWESVGRKVWNSYYGDRKALNLGIRGDRIQHVLWRLDNGNLDGIQPKVAVVMIGTNNSGHDTVSDIAEGVRAVVDEIQQKVPGIKILLLDIFPRGKRFNATRGNMLQVNQTVRKLHDGKKVIYLPIGHHFLEDDGSISSLIMPDYLHPSPLGYEIWAAQTEPALAALLGDTPKSPDSIKWFGA
jgi:beta-glucosidase